MAEPGQVEEAKAIAVMPVPVEVPALSQPQARAFSGEVAIARILRGGAIAGGALFGASLVVELLPTGQDTSVAISVLRNLGVVALLMTPIARLATSGLMLGLRGEYRYAIYAAGVLALLGLAIGAGMNA